MWLRLIFLFVMFPGIVHSQDIKLYDVVSERNIIFPSYGESGIAVVIFTSNVCPYSVYYNKKIKSIYRLCEVNKIQLLLINSNSSRIKPQESIELMKTNSLNNDYTFPYLADKEQLAQKLFDAKKNPQAFILRKSENGFKLLYSGNIDDNPRSDEGVKNRYLENAIEKALLGQSSEHTHAFGCSIKN